MPTRRPTSAAVRAPSPVIMTTRCRLSCSFFTTSALSRFRGQSSTAKPANSRRASNADRGACSTSERL